MLATMPVVESRPGGRDMPRHRRGNERRAAILQELYRREQAGEPPPTVSDLAASLTRDGKQPGDKTVYFHLVVLRDHGLVTWQPLVARTLQLTAAGRAEVTKA